MASKKPINIPNTPSPDTLRARAEVLLRTTRDELATMPAGDVKALVHELQVHQMELEIQNEELRNSQVELAHSRDRFSDLYEFAPVGFLSLEADGTVLEANLTAAKILGVTRQDLAGSNITRFVAHDDQDRFYRHRQTVLAGESTQTCELTMQRADGTRLESTAYNDDDAIAPHCRTALIDVSAEKQAEERGLLAQRMKRLVENLPAGAVYAENEQVHLNRAAEEITGYNRAALRTRDQWFATLYGPRQEEARALFEENRQAGFLERSDSVITRRDGEERIIEFAAHGFDEHEVWFLTDVTERQMLEQHVINAAEEERRRTAHELHDGIGSLLTGIDYRMKALANECTAQHLAQEDEVNTISKLVRDAITQARAIARGLHPVGTHPEDLMIALETLVSQAASASNVPCQFLCHPAVLIQNPLIANHLFRIAQEALNNAVKHSGATHITVSLAQKNGATVLNIMDDGREFDLNVPEAGLGLHTMHYRARAIGATLTVEHRQSGGINVVCAIPTPT